MTSTSRPIPAAPRPPRRARSLAALSLACACAALATPAVASDFADPPGPSGRGAVAVDPDQDGHRYEAAPCYPPLPDEPSIVRFYVGPAGKLDGSSAAPGLLAAADVGKGPAMLRLTAAWLDVGAEKGLSQYSGELAVDFGGRSRLRPVIGAGAGLARTSIRVRDDGTIDPDRGASVGVGLVRAGLGWRLPFEEADARVALDLVGTLAAIRGNDAPDLSPWLVTSISVGVGF
jgi:hypothetical protein